jgi:hypothetical protein
MGSDECCEVNRSAGGSNAHIVSTKTNSSRFKMSAPQPAPASASSAAAAASRAILRNFTLDQELAVATEVVDGEIWIEVSIFANARSTPLGIYAFHRYKASKAESSFKCTWTKAFRLKGRQSFGLPSPATSTPSLGRRPFPLLPLLPTLSKRTGHAWLPPACLSSKRRPGSATLGKAMPRPVLKRMKENIFPVLGIRMVAKLRPQKMLKHCQPNKSSNARTARSYPRIRLTLL